MKPDARPAPTPSTADGSARTAGALPEGEVEQQQFWLALTDEQVQELVRQEAESRGTGRGLLGVLLSLNGIGKRISQDELTLDERYHDRRISQSVVHSLLVLSPFASGEAHGLYELAEEVSMANSTVWRYLKTWVAIGVLEERRDRRYQLAVRWRRELSKRTRRSVGASAG